MQKPSEYTNHVSHIVQNTQDNTQDSPSVVHVIGDDGKLVFVEMK